MAFWCPRCKTPGSLEIARSISLPSDSRSDEILLQVVACAQCSFRGLAVYEESRRGAFDEDAWEHTGFETANGALEALEASLQGCPAPSNPACGCEAHRDLGARDAQGRWKGLKDIDLTRTFPLRMA